jgi:hypothetical protein
MQSMLSFSFSLSLSLSPSLDNKNTKPHQSSLAHLLLKLPVKTETICENVQKTPPV